VKGKLVLIPFPFTDLTSTKLRPALVLMEGDRDCVVAFISSKMPTTPSSTDILIPESHEEFTRTGLKRTSVIRLDKIATISKDLVVGEIGELGEALRKEINTRLRETYQL
jgi:mRNA interferase MazF